MPVLPLQHQSKQAPVLLGTSTNDAKPQVNFRVKNTFIDGEDDDTMPSPTNHQRHHTCPASKGPLLEDDVTPRLVHSRYSTDSAETSSSLTELDGSSPENQPTFGKRVSFGPGQADAGTGSVPQRTIRVKNTFIDTDPGSSTPAARRRNQTCPPEQIDCDEDSIGYQSEEEGLAADPQRAQSSRTSTSTSNHRSSGARMRLGNRRLSTGAGSPVARPNRAALATEDLREQFEEYSLGANTYAQGQNCPSGYVPYETAAAAVAYAAAWPATYMAHQQYQQIALAARVSADLLWPWCPSTTLEHPPPLHQPLVNFSTSAASVHSSPTSPAVAPAGPSPFSCCGNLVSEATSPVVPQAAPVGMQARAGAFAPGLVSGVPQQADCVMDEKEMSAATRRGPRRLRLWAHIYLHMQLEGFDLIPRLIGRGGCNMRKIAEATGSKLRIRGRGSGHLEIEGKAEAPTPLMVAVTTDHADPAMFRKAIEMTIKELKVVQGRFNSFCEKQGHVHIGPCYSVGVLQPNAAEALAGLLDVIPRSSVALDAAKASASGSTEER